MPRVPLGPESDDFSMLAENVLRVVLTLQRGGYCSVSLASNPDTYVQFARLAAGNGTEYLVAEASGPSEWGGPAALSTVQQVEMGGIGWEFIGRDGQEASFPNYRIAWKAEAQGESWISQSDALDLAQILVDTLRGPLGLHDPREVTWDHGNMQ